MGDSLERSGLMEGGEEQPQKVVYCPFGDKHFSGFRNYLYFFLQ